MANDIDQLTEANLSNFTGTTKYYRFMCGLLLTEGTHFVAEHGCHWLLVAVASHQSADLRAKADGHQFWKLRRLSGDPSHQAILVCEDGDGGVLLEQRIHSTDFPFDRFRDGEFQVWVEEGSLDGVNTVHVCLLPSEH